MKLPNVEGMEMERSDETIEKYLSDESNAFRADRDKISAVYYPKSGEDVKRILEEANSQNCLVTISGAGTSITGARVPIHGGIVISMEKMLETPDRPLEKITYQDLSGEVSIFVDKEKSNVFLSPGISLETLGKILPDNLFYPPDPTETSALIGSTIATGASGSRSFYYGTTREWINELKIVLANSDSLTVKRGEIFAQEGTFDFKSDSGERYSFQLPSYKMPEIKNAAGLYTKPNMDLIDLFIGSEGILGIITEVNAKVEKKPDILSHVAFFECDEDALGYVDELRRLKDKGVFSVEYLDNNSLDFVKEKYSNISDKYKAAVFVEHSDEEMLYFLADILERYNSIDSWIAQDQKKIEELKEFRHTLPDNVNSYLRQHQSYKVGTDFVVPLDKFPEMMRYYKEIGELFKQKSKRDGMHYVNFGHIGDCHMHFNFIAHSDEIDFAKKLYGELAKKALELGGTISGEHGVGKKVIQADGRDIPLLEFMYGRAALEEIARIKRVFDPNSILNIGNMVPLEYLITNR